MPTEEKVPSAQPEGIEFSPADPFWVLYSSQTEKIDRGLLEDWRVTTEGIVIFASLFSAVITAFIIESYKSLSPDSAEQSVTLLAQSVSLQQATILAVMKGATLPDSAVNSQPFQLPEFSPTWSAIFVNLTWFLSLFLSLTCALAAILVQQWCTWYKRTVEQEIIPSRRGVERVKHFDGLMYYKMPQFVDVIPGVLHLAFFTFLAGLSVFIININLALGTILTFLCIAGFSLYILTSTLALSVDYYPYSTPLTRWFGAFSDKTRARKRRVSELSSSQEKSQKKWEIWAEQVKTSSNHSQEDLQAIAKAHEFLVAGANVIQEKEELMAILPPFYDSLLRADIPNERRLELLHPIVDTSLNMIRGMPQTPAMFTPMPTSKVKLYLSFYMTAAKYGWLTCSTVYSNIRQHLGSPDPELAMWAFFITAYPEVFLPTGWAFVATTYESFGVDSVVTQVTNIPAEASAVVDMVAPQLRKLLKVENPDQAFKGLCRVLKRQKHNTWTMGVDPQQDLDQQRLALLPHLLQLCQDELTDGYKLIPSLRVYLETSDHHSFAKVACSTVQYLLERPNQMGIAEVELLDKLWTDLQLSHPETQDITSHILQESKPSDPERQLRLDEMKIQWETTLKQPPISNNSLLDHLCLYFDHPNTVIADQAFVFAAYPRTSKGKNDEQLEEKRQKILEILEHRCRNPVHPLSLDDQRLALVPKLIGLARNKSANHLPFEMATHIREYLEWVAFPRDPDDIPKLTFAGVDLRELLHDFLVKTPLGKDAFIQLSVRALLYLIIFGVMDDAGQDLFANLFKDVLEHILKPLIELAEVDISALADLSPKLDEIADELDEMIDQIPSKLNEMINIFKIAELNTIMNLLPPTSHDLRLESLSEWGSADYRPDLVPHLKACAKLVRREIEKWVIDLLATIPSNQTQSENSSDDTHIPGPSLSPPDACPSASDVPYPQVSMVETPPASGEMAIGMGDPAQISEPTQGYRYGVDDLEAGGRVIADDGAA